MKINFDDIVISNKFKASTPSKDKMDKCTAAYKQGVMDRDLVLDNNDVLIDGYVLYCVLKNAGFKGEVEVKYPNRYHTYVFGRHYENDKERVWGTKLPYEQVKESVGQKALVSTKNGVAPITVTRVEQLEKPPYDGCIRKVVSL